MNFIASVFVVFVFVFYPNFIASVDTCNLERKEELENKKRQLFIAEKKIIFDKSGR